MKPKSAPTSTRPGRPGPFKPRPARVAPPSNDPRSLAGSVTPAERVTPAGLVRVAEGDVVAGIPLHYHSERSRWYGPNGHGGFANLSDSQAKSLVAEFGFHKGLKDDRGNTPADRTMLWLVQNRGVAHAGALAGYRAGVHEVNGARILVTETPRLVEPRPGDWPTIGRLVETMLADPGHDQISRFRLWLAESFAAYWRRMSTPGPWPFHYCPALALFGPRGCGKTALIDLVLSPLFGGRRGDPMTYLRERRFNKDLFGASLLVMDDKGAAAGLHERRERGEAIKDLIWREEQRMEGKGADALMLRPFWRLVIAGNDDDAGLQVCPTLSPSLEDKLLLLRARPAEGLPSDRASNAAWVAAIEAELPAFAAALLGWRPPAELVLDPRTRVANFWHPELVAALREMQPEARLLELLDQLNLIEPPAPRWEGSASKFEQELRAKDPQRLLDRVFLTSTSAGRLLSELARVEPGRVERTNRGGLAHYRVFPRPETL